MNYTNIFLILLVCIFVVFIFIGQKKLKIALFIMSLAIIFSCLTDLYLFKIILYSSFFIPILIISYFFFKKAKNIGYLLIFSLAFYERFFLNIPIIRIIISIVLSTILTLVIFALWVLIKNREIKKKNSYFSNL